MINENTSKLFGLIATTQYSSQEENKQLTEFTFDDYAPAFYGMFDDMYPAIEDEDEFNALVEHLNSLATLSPATVVNKPTDDATATPAINKNDTSSVMIDINDVLQSILDTDAGTTYEATVISDISEDESEETTVYETPLQHVQTLAGYLQSVSLEALAHVTGATYDRRD